jgi:hypothetical protein
MDKFGEPYKATVAVFHGIIATWLFLDFSERKVNEFYFVILLVFFTVANLLVWHAVLDVVRRLRGARPQAATAIGIEGISYRPVDVAILSIIAALVGLTAAAIDRRDAVLRLGSLVADWHRTSSDSPFDLMMSDVTEKRLGQLDKRDVQLVQAAAKDGLMAKKLNL